MAIVTGFTAEHMKEIEDATVVGGKVDAFGNLILETRGGEFLLGGHVSGAPGEKGDKGDPGAIDEETLNDINDKIDENASAIEKFGITPQAPANLVLRQNSAMFLNDGSVLTKLYFDWDVVATATTGESIRTEEYEIWTRSSANVPSTPFRRTPDPYILIEAWNPGEENWVSVRARAVGSTAWSDLSTEISVTPVFPAFVNIPPTKPVLKTDQGMVIPYWDGEVVEGDLSKSFFRLTTEYLAAPDTWEALAVPTVQEGQTGMIKSTPGAEVSVRFRWVDTLGRISNPSEIATIITKGVGKVDLTTEIQQALDKASTDSAAALEAVMSTVSSVTVEYSVGNSETVPPTTGWDATSPTRTPGTYIWTRTVITYLDNTSETSAPALLTGNSGGSGPAGAAGKGLQSSVITYQTGTSATQAPTGTWSSTPTATTTGQYLWTRTVLTWTDSSTSTAYSVAAHGASGAAGAAGRGITATTITYQKSADGTTAPTGTWTTAIPTLNPGEFLWTKTTHTYSDNSTTTGYSVGRSGTNGANGAKGDPGSNGETSYLHTAYANSADGVTGFSVSDPANRTYLGTYTDFVEVDSTNPADYTWVKIQGPQGATGGTGPTGKGISSSAVHYQTSSSGTTVPTGTWVTTIPAASPGQFIWTRTTITFTDGATQISYSTALQGATGPQGIQGPPGADGTERFTWIKYADTPTTGMSDSPTGKTYMGIAYNKTTSTESSSYSDYEWSLIQGPKGDTGDTGATGKGISSTAVTYSKSTSGTTAPTTGWVASPIPVTVVGEFLWTRTITTYTDSSNSTAYSVSAHGATGPTGNTGATGRGISSTAVTYAKSSSGTSEPTTGWGTTIPATSPGEFLWTRTIITYTSGSPTTTTSYAVSAHGVTGQQGIQGPPGLDGQPTYTWIKYGTSSSGAGLSDDPAGKTYIGIAYNKTTPTESTTASDYEWSLIQGPQGDKGDTGSAGRGIASTAVTYQKSTSGTTAPTGTWVSTIPTLNPGEYLWTRTVLTYTDATTSTSYSVGRVGTNGSNGAPGSPGANGQTSYLHTAYATSADGVSGFSTSDPNGKTYLGTYTNFVEADSTTPSDYTWVKIQGPQGDTGATGNTGATGKGISSSVVHYQASSSGVTIPTGTWVTSIPVTSAGQYLWTRTTITFTDGATQLSYSTALQGATGPKGDTGNTGNTGATGVGISSITPYYLTVGADTAAPAKPTANPPGGSWSLTEPGYVSSTDLYRTELIVYTNGTFAYTNVVKVSAYTAATQAVTVANLADAKAQGMVKASATDPGHQNGRIWLVLNASGRIIGMKTSDGSAWSSYLIMADQILVPSSVGTVSIANGAVVASKITAVDFTNYFQDPSWTDPGFTWNGWTKTANVGVQKAGTATQSGGYATLTKIAVKPGEKYRVSATRTNVAGSGGDARIYMQTFNSAGTFVGTISALSMTSAGAAENMITIPANIYYINIGFYTESNMPTTTTVRISDVDIRRMVGTLIEPDSVSAAMLKASQIWADEAWLNVLRTGIIETEMVTPGFGDTLNLTANGAINAIIETQVTMSSNISDVQDLAQDAGAAAANAGIQAATAKSAADAANTKAGDVEKAQTATETKVNTLQTWFRVDSAGAHIGQTGSPFQTHMKPDRFEITDNNKVTTYWASGQMVVPSAVVTTIELSNHKIEPYGTGTVIRAIGV